MAKPEAHYPRMTDKMHELLRSFPSLREQDDEGVFGKRWDPQKLDTWAAGPYSSSGSLAAARFILSVFNPYVGWESGRFDLHEAMRHWDAQHKAAFAAWAAKPYYP